MLELVGGDGSNGTSVGVGRRSAGTGRLSFVHISGPRNREPAGPTESELERTVTARASEARVSLNRIGLSEGESERGEERREVS